MSCHCRRWDGSAEGADFCLLWSTAGTRKSKSWHDEKREWEWLQLLSVWAELAASLPAPASRSPPEQRASVVAEPLDELGQFCSVLASPMLRSFLVMGTNAMLEKPLPAFGVAPLRQPVSRAEVCVRAVVSRIPESEPLFLASPFQMKASCDRKAMRRRSMFDPPFR